MSSKKQEKKAGEEEATQSQKTEEKKAESEYEDDGEEYEQKAEFKAHRKFMYTLGRMLKYASWLLGGVFLYHLYLVTNTDKP